MNASIAPLKGLAILFRRGHLQQMGTPTLIAAVVLLICGMLLLGANVSALSDSFAWVQRTDGALMALSEVELRLAGNETAIRGYALTDDPVFLSYQQNETRQTWTTMEKLGNAVEDDPDQVARFVSLRAKVNARLETLARLGRLGPGHAQDVANAIRDPQFRKIMREARAQAEEFRVAELKVLAERQASAAGQAQRTYAIAIGIVVLAFVFGALGLAIAQAGRGLNA
ncbi:MAG: CHASE3 domain-containing protein [Alphaproteobacteria bacterium]|nr:CHASE3 domain-containing protein [Alphaproteobacteria bacterium]MDE2631010.1 CHASE3 domain-containing protein [Alphaproteobacteria bacterium]